MPLYWPSRLSALFPHIPKAWNEDEIVASMRILLWLTPMLFFSVLLICSKLYWIEFYSQGPGKGRGWGGGGVGRWASPLFEKKNYIKKYTFSNKGNFWWNKNIRLADLAKAYKFMIGPFRSYITMVSFKMTISTKLHLVVADKGVFFLSRFLNLHWGTIS